MYSDHGLTNLVVDDPDGVSIDLSQLMPGKFHADYFKPSNFYASATKVAYDLQVKPQHLL